MAAKYIFGSGQINGIVSKLSGSTKDITSTVIQDPYKVENIIGMVRTFAPLTSNQTVTKLNTYLPVMEKISTLIGMYSFLNRAQTFRPIESSNAKTPVEKITALMKSGNLPVGKMLAQPILSNNMDKIIGTVASNMLKNGNLNDILAAVANQSSSDNNSEGNGNFDINNLMETFMPLINNIASSSSEKPENDSTQEPSTNEDINVLENPEQNSQVNITNTNEEAKIQKTEETHQPIDPKKHENHKPIRIKQRRRR